ncbi:hypothetical protein TWF217_008641 [Orbilia oligospora]|nr:hypothetical protein TWF217_008641 [Orbilia oligospora]
MTASEITPLAAGNNKPESTTSSSGPIKPIGNPIKKFCPQSVSPALFSSERGETFQFNRPALQSKY